MSKVVAFTSLTLDGGMQAPGPPDEDRRRGFEHGGWATPYADSVQGEVVGASMDNTGPMRFGRRTYENFYSVWPKRTDDNPFTAVLNNSQKYVASATLKEPLPWINSTLLKGDAAEAVATLKAQPGKDIVVLGSGVLLQSLMRRNLADQYGLLLHPLLPAPGRPLFPPHSQSPHLRLLAAH